MRKCYTHMALTVAESFPELTCVLPTRGLNHPQSTDLQNSPLFFPAQRGKITSGTCSDGMTSVSAPTPLPEAEPHFLFVLLSLALTLVEVHHDVLLSSSWLNHGPTLFVLWPWTGSTAYSRSRPRLASATGWCRQKTILNRPRVIIMTTNIDSGGS